MASGFVAGQKGGRACRPPEGASAACTPVGASIRGDTLAFVDVVGCLACDLSAGREPLPGGVIHETASWRIEHCVGPLGVGTMLLKPRRHVTRIAELTEAEADEQGPLLRLCAIVIDELIMPEQTYACLWSHAGGEPVHIHHVVQPITRELMTDRGAYGPKLQVQMFETAQFPPDDEVGRFADQARAFIARTVTKRPSRR
jgi:diadenosine tetraphosphate (Ap4A) HIT family hydrolase